MNNDDDIDITVPSGKLKLTGYAPEIIVSNNVAIDIPTGKLKLTGYAPDVSVSKINDAIELSSDIPPDAKKAAKEFVEENIKTIIDNFEQLSNIDVPDPISDIWLQLIEIIKLTLGG